MVKIPVIAAGILRLPPISVPTPKGLPHAAIRADSPPDEPPEVSCRLRGLTVLGWVVSVEESVQEIGQ